MKKLFFLPLAILSFQAFSQIDLSAKYAAEITAADLKKHLLIVAGEEFEGRETGTEGLRKAAAYIENQFGALNLKQPASLKSYQQFYPLHRDSLLQTALIVNGKTAEYGKDYFIPAGTNENGKFRSNQLVFAGYGISDSAYNDYASVNVKGKVVVIFLGEPKKEGKYFITPGKMSSWTFPGLNRKLETAAAKGAVGVLLINPNMESFSKKMADDNVKGKIYYPKTESKNNKLNYALLSHAFAKDILPVNFDAALATAKANGEFLPKPTDTKIKTAFTFQKYRNIINVTNVIGLLEGTDKKNEFVVLSAHYDHLGKHDGKIYYGADDDGSGTCAVIEMAQAFTKAAAEGKRPRRSIVFIAFSGEEKGLWGSEYYSDNPLYPLDKTSVNLNIDMIGRTDTERKTADTLNYVYVVGHDKLSTELPIVNEDMNKKYTNLVLDYKFDDPNDPTRIYYRSDHYNFARKGVPVLFFYDGMLKADYHKPTDTVDKINFALYEKRTRLVFHTAWEIANRNEMLKRDLPLPTGKR